MAQNYIQQADQLKTAPDAWLSKELKTPSGSFPGFLIAAEAAKRASTRSKAATPQKGTVAQSLGSRLDSMRQELPAEGPQQMPPPTAMPPMQSAQPEAQGLGGLSTPETQGYEGGGKVGSKKGRDQNWKVELKDGVRPTFDYSDFEKQLFQEESKGGQNIWNPNHVYGGPYQMNMSRGIDPDTGKFKHGTYNYYAERMGLPLSDGKTLPPVEAQQEAYRNGYYPDLLNNLQKSGTDLSQSNVYMGHKYGAGAVPTLLKNWQEDPNQGWTRTLNQIYGKEFGDKVAGQNVLGKEDRNTLGKEIFRLRQNFHETARDPNEFYAEAGRQEPIGGFGMTSMELDQDPEQSKAMEEQRVAAELAAYNSPESRIKRANERSAVIRQKAWDDGVQMAQAGANLLHTGVMNTGDAVSGGLGYLYNEATRDPTPEESQREYERRLNNIFLREEMGPSNGRLYNQGGTVHLDSGSTAVKRKQMNPFLLGTTGPIQNDMSKVVLADQINGAGGGNYDQQSLDAWRAGASPEDNALLYDQPEIKVGGPRLKNLRGNDSKIHAPLQTLYGATDVFDNAKNDLASIWSDRENSKFTGAPVTSIIPAMAEVGGRGLASLVPLTGMASGAIGMGTSAIANALIGDINDWKDPRPKNVPKWMINMGQAGPSDYEDGMPKAPGYDVGAPIDVSPEEVAAATAQDPVLAKAAADRAASESSSFGSRGALGGDLQSIMDTLNKLNPEGARQKAYADSVDRLFGEKNIEDMQRQNSATALMQAAGAMMQPGSFGENLGRAFTTGSGAYAAGNDRVQKFRMEQLGGLSDLAKTETSRGDKNLAGAVDIYTAQVAADAKRAAKAAGAGGAPYDVTVYPEVQAMAMDAARQRAGIPKEGEINPEWLKKSPAQKQAAYELQMNLYPDLLHELAVSALGNRIYKTQKQTPDAAD